LVKKGAEEITEIKSDKGSIGGMHSHNDRFFAQHTIQLEKGDRVYLFTDGITDQFGADTNKKLRPVNFRTWILESAEIPFDEQESFYAGKLAEWQKEESQTDDILVMGFGL
jgi:serine phosphatase RsbU (regulator of sigma subunit)